MSAPAVPPLGELDRIILANVSKFPLDTDLVVAAPGDGLLPAVLVALYLQLPFTDTRALRSGRPFTGGHRLRRLRRPQHHADVRAPLVLAAAVQGRAGVDALRRAVAPADLPVAPRFAAVVADPEAAADLDITLSITPSPSA